MKILGLIKTAGVVTKTVKYGDTSLIATLITADLGKISVIANNVRTNRSGLKAGLQLFAYSDFVIYASKSKNGLYRLNELSIKESFSDIRMSLEKLAYASYFADVVNKTTAEQDSDGEVLQLLLNTLYVLNGGLCSAEKIKTVFEWRTAAILGYAPHLDKCVNCGEECAESISLVSGGVLCDKCAAALSGTVRISELMKKIIHYICYAESKKIFSFDAPEQVINYLSRVSELYIEAQFETGFPTLEFLKKVTENS